MGLQDTPRGDRLHIGLFGRRNAGKSSLVNALTGQEAALVSPVAGTTADPVYKAMELPRVGPVVFMDTAGFDDDGAIGTARVEKTRQAAEKADMALLLFAGEEMAEELRWADWFKARRVPVIPLVSRCDDRADDGAAAGAVRGGARRHGDMVGGPRPCARSGACGGGRQAIWSRKVRIEWGSSMISSRRALKGPP